jgi:hypothetical protein
MVCGLQFVDFSWRPTCHLWEDEPRDNNGDRTRTCEAATQNLHQPSLSSIFSILDKKAHLQKTCLDTPFSGGTVDHEGCAEAEHNAREIRYGEGPSRSLRS